MSRNFPASTTRLMLACVLSLLALTFAVEAKIAWYGPAVGPGSEVRAAKALPIDTREIGVGSAPATDPATPLIPYTLLVIFAAAFVLEAARRLPLRRNAPWVYSILAVLYFSPQTAFRPPPAR